MIIDEFDMNILTERVTKEVMRLVNKHHSDTRFEVANYKRALTHTAKKFQAIEHRYMVALGIFNKGKISLPARLEELQNTMQANHIGVQNVYNKFLELEQRIVNLEEEYKRKC